MQLGELRQARAELEAVPALYDPRARPGPGRPLRHRSPRLGAVLPGARAVDHGLPGPGAAHGGRGDPVRRRAAARQHDRPRPVPRAGASSPSCLATCRRPAATPRRLIALAAEHDMPMWRGYGLVLRGWALAEEGRARGGACARAPGHRGAGRARHGVPPLPPSRAPGRHPRPARRPGRGPAAAGGGVRRGGADRGAACSRPSSAGSRGSCGSSRARPRRRRRRASPRRSPWRAGRRPGRSSCAPRPASPACGGTRASAREARDLLAPVYGWFTEGLRHAGPAGCERIARRARLIWSTTPLGPIPRLAPRSAPSGDRLAAAPAPLPSRASAAPGEGR